MPKIRRVRAHAQLPFAADHVVIVKTNRGTYEVSGKADVDGVIERFAPVQFADLSGALSIATYWASVQNVPILHVLAPNRNALIEGFATSASSVLKVLVAGTRKARSEDRA